MVHVLSMGEFVVDDMVMHHWRQKDEAPIQGKSPLLGAGTPTRGLVADADAIHLNPNVPREAFNRQRQARFSEAAENANRGRFPPRFG
jgi:hypothetical protein